MCIVVEIACQNIRGKTISDFQSSKCIYCRMIKMWQVYDTIDWDEYCFTEIDTFSA